MSRLDFYRHLTRRKPGSIVFTSSYLTPLPLDRHSVIADLGCGFGHRATWIARSRCCQVHAFDQSSEYLEYTHQRAEEGGSESLIHLHHTDQYASLDLPNHSLDLLMAEGIGFHSDPFACIDQWRQYIKPKGHIAITFPGVVNRHPPRELVAPLVNHTGRELSTLDDYHNELSKLNIRLVHQVQLPPYSWEDHYQNCHRLLQGLLKHQAELASESWVQEIQDEIQWYRKYGRGRVFLQAFILALP
jgi:SAM-dependent methyltransferase